MHLGPSHSRPDCMHLSLQPCNFFGALMTYSIWTHPHPSSMRRPAFKLGHSSQTYLIRTYLRKAHPCTSMGECTRMLVVWICMMTCAYITHTRRVYPLSVYHPNRP